jgi:L-cystine transport system substrate-binding protein
MISGLLEKAKRRNIIIDRKGITFYDSYRNKNNSDKNSEVYEMKKLTMSILFFLGAVFLLAACGNNAGNEESAGTGNEGQEDQSLYEQIQENGELQIGTEGTYPPFTFHDESGELTGFDVEIAREVADRLGVEPVFKETQWDAMFEGLNSNRFDMIANQVGIREDRQEKYDFSIPYIESSAVLVASKDSDIDAFEDIEGLTSAQSLTSNYRDIAESYGAEIQGVDGLAQAIQLLEQGRVDVTVNDKLSILDYLQTQKNAGVEIVATQEEAAQSGLMFRKGNEQLVEEVNKALEEMMEDGTYAEISEKWFGEDVSPR